MKADDESRTMRLFMVLSVILLSAGLPACASFGRDAAVAARPVAPDPAETLLTQAALRAGRALAALARRLASSSKRAARARSAENPLAETPLPRLVPAALLRTVALDWTGPLETLAEDLARRAGYRFLAAGPVPARPAMVILKAGETTLIAALRDAGIQAGQAATLTVDAGRQTVQLDWAVPNRSFRTEKTGKTENTGRTGRPSQEGL